MSIIKDIPSDYVEYIIIFMKFEKLFYYTAKIL